MKGNKEKLSHGDTSSIWLPVIDQGSHCFIVSKYSLAKGLGVGKCILSDQFEVGGYSWQIQFYPDGETYAADYISIFLKFASGEVDAMATFEFLLFDQSGHKSHKVYSETQPIAFRSNSVWGWRQLMKRSDLEGSNLLKDDNLHIHCKVTVISRPKVAQNKSIELPPSDIEFPPSDISITRYLWESGKGADVIFEVDGENFSAHKLILAARSSVFNAQFFGSLKDNGDHPIQVQETKAPVFKALLHFIYCDNLPYLDEFFQEMTQTLMYQHLLIAADRYDLDRLKLVCAAHLSSNIAFDNVFETWVLAETHHCSQLTSFCVEFAAFSNDLQDVMQATDFELTESDPSMFLKFVQSVVSYTRESTSEK